MTADRFLSVLLRLDAGFNLALAAGVLGLLGSLSEAAGMAGAGPLVLFSVACLGNGAVCWVAAGPDAPLSRTRLTAAIDLVLAAVIALWALTDPAGMAGWLRWAAIALADAALVVGVAKLALAARVGSSRASAAVS